MYDSTDLYHRWEDTFLAEFEIVAELMEIAKAFLEVLSYFVRFKILH